MQVLRFWRTNLQESSDPRGAGAPYKDLDSTEIPALRAIVNAAAFQVADADWNGKTFNCGDHIPGEKLQQMLPAIRNFVGPRKVKAIDITDSMLDVIRQAKDAVDGFLRLVEPHAENASVTRERYDELLEGLADVDDLWKVFEPDYLYIGGEDINLADLLDLMDFLEASYEEGVYIHETETDEYDDEDED